MTTFNCLVVLMPERVKTFKNLFNYSGKQATSFNFGVITNFSETKLSNGNIILEFDCQNEHGIYYGWYKTDQKNMEAYCKELDILFFSALCDWHDSEVDLEEWYFDQKKGLSITSYIKKERRVDVQAGVDYNEKRLAKKETELC